MATAPSDAAPDDDLDRFVRAEMARQRIPGVAIGIIRADGSVKAAGYGFADLEHQVPVTARTLFQSASAGKHLTAIAAMLLVEDGKLALDDSVATYFPEAPRAFHAVTVRHLLGHTGGIPEYTDGGFDYQRDYTEADLIAKTLARPPEFTPGTRWSYSNTGYALLGFLIGRAGGQHYGEILRTRVFGPAGMTSARVISEADVIPHRASGYRLVGGEVKHQTWVSPMLNTTGDGALYWSIDDLVAWDRTLRAGAILKPESWKLIYAPAVLAGGETHPYGFGWDVAPVRGHARHRHDGDWQGFKVDIVRFPDDGLTVVALCNLAEAVPERFTDGLVALIAPELAP